MSSRSYLGIAAHFEHKYELYSINLGVYQMSVQHTAVNIQKTLLEACEEWEIPVNKITALVTDNGSNVVLAADLYIGKKGHLRCFAHTVNLVATDSIKSVNGLTDLIKKVKSIVTFFRESNNASDQLRTQTDLKLIQDVPTRWNSTFYMLERFLQLKQIVSTVLLNYPKGPSMLTAAEIEIMTEVLRPLESVTRDMSGEKYVTASKVIPMIRLMTRQYERLNTYEEYSTQLKNAIIREFKQRWSKVEFNHMLAMATILDPRFKKMHFQDPLAVFRSVRFIAEEVRNVNQLAEVEQAALQNDQVATADLEQNHNFSIWDDHNQLIATANENLRNDFHRHELPNELKVYLQTPVSALKVDPLKLWKELSLTSPSVAKVVLCT